MVMARSKQRKLLFVAEGQTSSGETKHFSVYEEGTAFYIVGPNPYQHLCHLSVKNHEGIKREIALVFDVKVTDVKLPWELHSHASEEKGESQT